MNSKLLIGDEVKCWKNGILYDGTVHSVRKNWRGEIRYTVGLRIINRYAASPHTGVMTFEIRYFDFKENELERV